MGKEDVNTKQKEKEQNKMIDINVLVNMILMNCDDSIEGIKFGNGYTIKKIDFDSYNFKDRIVDGRGQLDIKYMSSKLEKNGKTYFWGLQKEEKYLSEAPEISGNAITDKIFELPSIEVYKKNEILYINRKIALLHLFKAGNIGYNEIFFVHNYKTMGIIENTRTQISTNASRNYIDDRKYSLLPEEVTACNIYLTEYDGMTFDLLKTCIDEFIWGIEQIDVPTGFEQYTTVLEMTVLESNCSYKKVCLAKRIAVLIGDDNTEINEIYNKMINYYRYRSESLHEGDGRNITITELIELEEIARKVLNKYLVICKREVAQNSSITWTEIKANQIMLLKSMVTTKITEGILPA